MNVLKPQCEWVSPARSTSVVVECDAAHPVMAAGEWTWLG
nr:hypothetical protein [Kibdelosporangium sp. MJ126-NF4]